MRIGCRNNKINSFFGIAALLRDSHRINMQQPLLANWYVEWHKTIGVQECRVQKFRTYHK